MRTKKFIVNQWLDFTIPLKSKSITLLNLVHSLQKFWKDVVMKVDKTMLLQFKIKTDVKGFNSISYVQRVNPKDYKKVLSKFIEF